MLSAMLNCYAGWIVFAMTRCAVIVAWDQELGDGAKTDLFDNYKHR
jgi:hypothetical protein